MALADTARLIASLELQDKFSGPAKRAEGSIGGLDRKVSSLGQVGQRASAGLGSLATNVAKLGVAAGALTIGVGVVAITASVRAASDLNEEIDKSAVVFGKAAPKVQEFANNAAAIGLSSAEALGAAGNFGNMLNTVGLAQDKSADMSVTMVKLAADMASFNNEDPSDMLDRLRSGLAGEAEPLRRFGVLLSEAEVKAFAVREGIAGANETLTEAQKVQARYGLILEQTSLQQGNFADTSDSLANQQRILRGNIQNTAASFGQTLLPVISRVLKAVNTLFIEKRPEIIRFGFFVGQAFDQLFSNKNLDEGSRKIGKLIDKVSSFNPQDLNFSIDADDGGKTTTLFASIGGIAEQVKGLPWESIANAARLLGTGSKALLDAFLGLPPWVQTAVLTGWGLNKLTGGALTGIVGALTSGLVKGILGINAGVVNINAGTVTGGGGGLPGGGRGGLVGGVVGGLAAGVGVGLAAVAAVKVVEFIGDANAQAEDLRSSIEALPNQTAGELNDSLAAIERAQQAAIDGPLSGIVTELFGVQYDLKTNKTELINTRNDLARNIVRGTDATTRSVDRVNSSVALERAAQQAIAAADAARIQRLTDSHNSANAYLQQIRDKPTSFTANVTTSIQLSASAVAINLQRVTQTTNVRPDINEVVL